MKDFKDYAKEKPQESGGGETFGAFEKNGGDWIPLLLSEAKKARAQGKLSDREIDGFMQKISPVLAPIERAALKRMIDEIRSVRPDGARE